MLHTRWTLLVLLAVIAPGCTLVDQAKTDHRLKGYAKHAWERYEACYEDTAYEDEMEEGFEHGYLQFVYRGTTTMPRCLPTKYNRPKYQNCFGKAGIQAYQQGFQLGIQAAWQGCANGVSGGHKRCLSGSGRNGSCSTGNCQTGQCATGQCATGQCATGQCATGRCGTAPAVAAHLPSGNYAARPCATGTCATGNCATGSCGTGTCATCETGMAPMMAPGMMAPGMMAPGMMAPEGWQPQPGSPWAVDSSLPQLYEEVPVHEGYPGGLIPMPEAPAPSAIPEQRAPAPTPVPETAPEKTTMAVPPGYGTYGAAAPQSFGDHVIGPGQVLPGGDGEAEVNGDEAYAPAAELAPPVVSVQPDAVPPAAIPQPATVTPRAAVVPRATVAPEGWRPARLAPHEAGAFPEAGLVREPR